MNHWVSIMRQNARWFLSIKSRQSYRSIICFMVIIWYISICIKEVCIKFHGSRLQICKRDKLHLYIVFRPHVYTPSFISSLWHLATIKLILWLKKPYTKENKPSIKVNSIQERLNCFIQSISINGLGTSKKK